MVKAPQRKDLSKGSISQVQGKGIAAQGLFEENRPERTLCRRGQ
jgi:hypothetical protein